jgi:phosphohistidine phosphatase SixA
MSVRSIAVFLSALLLFAAPNTAFANADQLWQAVAQGRAVAMMRHAIAPGTGDPSGFSIGDCSTQRNLSDEGRAQARSIGEAFRANGVTNAVVLTSQWCRCRETAQLLGLGEPQDLPALNSFFADRDSGPAQTAQLVDFLRAQGETGPLVLVTHQVNITALTGIVPRSGETVVFTMTREGKVSVLGTIPPGG